MKIEVHLQIPILFIVFNRVDTTSKVFQAIKKQMPSRLFIAADGPRTGFKDDVIKCLKVREWILSNIDWECDVKTYFRKENTGCGHGPSEAISWFFDHVEKGIILEDDCLPNDSFFRFCEENLEKYRNDPNISIVSGNNFQPIQPVPIEEDYYFSVFPSTWGWSTWKRTWDGFEFLISQRSKQEINELVDFLFKEKKYRLWWINQLHWMQNNRPKDMWDFQFYFHCMKRSQLAIIPKANLVSNIGFGKMATHTTEKDSYFSNLATYELEFPLRHPEKIKRNYEADIFVQKMLFGEVETINLKTRFKRFIKQTFISYP